MVKKCIAYLMISLILLQVTGCYSYKAIKVEDAAETEKIEKVKITTMDDKTYIFTDVILEGSQVKGSVVPTRSQVLAGIHSEEISIPLEEIKKFEVNEYNIHLTIAAILLGSVALAFLITTIYMSTHPMLEDFNLK